MANEIQDKENEMDLNKTTDLSETSDFSVTNGNTDMIPVIIKSPEYICPVHGEIKDKTIELKADDVKLALCCLYCLADLLNKSTPKIKRIE